MSQALYIRCPQHPEQEYSWQAPWVPTPGSVLVIETSRDTGERTEVVRTARYRVEWVEYTVRSWEGSTFRDLYDKRIVLHCEQLA